MSFFTGLWPIFVKYLMGFGGVGVCVFVALFADVIVRWPPLTFLGLANVGNRVRNIFLIAAGAIALSLFSYGVGVSDEADRCKLQFEGASKAAVKRGSDARTGATRDVTRGVQDSRDTDN
jgi:hypothetical protein